MAQRLQNSWADRHRGAVSLFAVGLVAAGSVSAVAHYSLDHPERWIPDVAVGLAFVVVGVRSSRASPAGWMIGAVGLAWWLGNVLPIAFYLHRGVLLHALVLFPGRRAGPKAETWFLVLVEVGLVIPAVGGSRAGTVAFGVVVVIAAVWRQALSRTRPRREATAAIWAALVVGFGTIGSVALLVGLGATPSSIQTSLLLYQSALVGAALLLGWGLRRPAAGRLADLVVELDEAGSQTLRDNLRKTLGDPLLEIGLENEMGVLVDFAGVPIDLDVLGPERVATVIAREGGPDSVLVHHASFLQDPGFVEAVDSVTKLSQANAALNARVEAQVEALEASRSRLLTAEDSERRRLADQTRQGPGATLAQLEARLASVAKKVGGPTGDAARRALDQLRLAHQDLVAIADGLHPKALEQPLEVAIRELVDGVALESSVSVLEVPLVPAMKSAVYYVCSEAVTNVAKHAAASRLDVSVAVSDDRIRIVVTDDGVGGADPAAGTGLEGLVDRVRQLGGSVIISSPSGGGTMLVAELPLGNEPMLP